MKRQRGNKAKWILVIAALLMILFLSLIGFITDYLWFKELGYVSVFFTKLFTQLKIGVPLFILLTLLSYLYLKALKRGYFKKIKSDEHADEGKLNKVAWLFSSMFSIFITFLAVRQLWYKALQFTNSTDFNITDPLFSKEISFYIFKLDFITMLNELVITAIIGVVILSALYYIVMMAERTPQMFESEGEDNGGTHGGQTTYGGYNSDPYGEQYQSYGNQQQAGPQNLEDLLRGFLGGGHKAKAQKARKKFDDSNFMSLLGIATKSLIAIGVLFFLMLGVFFYLRQFGLLYSSTGVLYGAGFTDINVTLWVYRILMALSVVGALMFAVGVLKKNFKAIIVVPVIMVLVGAVGTGAATLVQNLVVSPDEINKESKYLERNITYTQYAYDLGNVDVKEFSASNNLTLEDIQANPETINNIRINDFEPTEKFYNQTQSIRQYYTFNDVDVDRYMINGEYTQVFLSAREIDEGKIQQEWLNKHIKYTHGYGVTLSRVDRITSSGQPDMLIDSIPPVSQVEEIEITRPEIYFGELTKNYILVGTDEAEFDYPDGNTNRYANYEGTAGIELNLLNRALFSIREGSLKLLVSTNIDSDSRIIINRNIQERVQKIMPYLTYDNDPYIVTVDGKLYWVIDAYTTSSQYPYSEPYRADSNTNYIRNSVKVIIDAYNGETNYYLVDDQDPIANTMKSIYPDLFKDFSEMPESMQSHMRYPNALFALQADVYKRYHMTDVNVFYQGEDLWDISKEIYGTEEATMTPNYYIMKLPGETSAEFVNTIPYTPRDKQNMTALLVARNDGEHYGDLVLYQLPKGRVIYGPAQIEAQIDQSTEISKEFSLWNSSGSTYTRGNIFVIPIKDSLIYVEPVYLEATNSSIPEVKRVIVAYDDRIAYEATLSEALTSLFGASGAQRPVDASGESRDYTQTELVNLANKAFENAQEAQQSGDWAGYGKYIDELEEYLVLLAR